jgi:hypothetical protein
VDARGFQGGRCVSRDAEGKPAYLLKLKPKNRSVWAPATSFLLCIRARLQSCRPRPQWSGLYRLRKTPFFEGYGLQPVHKRLKIGTASAAEGRISIRLPTFSAASLAPVTEKPQEMPNSGRREWQLRSSGSHADFKAPALISAWESTLPCRRRVRRSKLCRPRARLRWGS